MRAKYKQIAIGIAVAIFWLGVWALVAVWMKDELLLPAPWVVARTLWQLIGTADFWMAVGQSVLRVLAGFVSAVLVGTVLAVLTTRFSFLHALFSPVLHLVQAAPVASFIILAYVWVQVGLLPAFIAFFMVIPLVWSNVRQGIVNTDRNLLEMAEVFRLGGWRTLRNIWYPSVKPYLEAALTTGFGFAWKSGIAAEVICQPRPSIGQYMYAAKAYLETSEVIAWTVVVVVLSVLLERLLLRLFGKKGVRV